MHGGAHRATTDHDRLARRNVLVLACAQALGGASPPIVVSLGGIVGHMLASDKALATLPVSLLNLGLAMGTIPAAMLMRRLGRRPGYLIGALIGAVAGAIATAGISLGAFAVFCLGTLVAGIYGAFVQSYRFAAADVASEAFRPRAISWVMFGGLASAVIGPQLVIWTRDALPGVSFAGSFLAQGALALLAVPVVAQLRAPPVGALPPAGGRPLVEIVRTPRFIIAVVSGLVSYGLMSFMMTAAPLAMVGCGHSIGEAALGIQWHVLSMFAPSFFTGRLIARFGKEAVTATGLALIAVAAAVALSGLGVAHFWIALVLLGLGWNFGFIGATAMVTDCYRPEERAKVQAANDFLVFGSVALASFSSGKLLDAAGWTTVNWLVFPPIAVVILLVLRQARTTRRRRPAA
ncbi:MFS transporter [Chelatococcus sp. SYSU_G07232]|uniref:MFS transporter n=1 Tax=Chelatococcus albus TaxID=3047466 RepID=A0ABT7AC32_9HYPH|nr:MFS transporter [Chelatococcus sp. SYSU_G07232]MDJ1156929.1 MFS transporter [Chelatococcus sp. SYSU_G07232]